MVRPPQFERPEDLTRDVTAVKVAIKHFSPDDRAWLLAWMLLYYRDDGAKFLPQIGRRRDRIMLNGMEFWLALENVTGSSFFRERGSHDARTFYRPGSENGGFYRSGFAARLERGEDPVSYTHLDVYKRQAQTSMPSPQTRTQR